MSTTEQIIFPDVKARACTSLIMDNESISYGLPVCKCNVKIKPDFIAHKKDMGLVGPCPHAVQKS